MTAMGIRRVASLTLLSTVAAAAMLSPVWAATAYRNSGSKGESKIHLLADMSLTRTPQGGAFYQPGTLKSITLQMDYNGTEPITALGVHETLPPGWTFDSVQAGSTSPTLLPASGAGGEIAFGWIVPPAFPATFSYTVQAPPAASGTQTFQGDVEYRTGGGALFSDTVQTGLTQRIAVTIPDPGLEAALREALSIPTEPLYNTDLATLGVLHAEARGIVDLTGIEYCGTLTELTLNDNQIVNLTPLAALTNLGYLDLAINQIIDLAPLTGLSGLGFLNLSDNKVADLTPLAGHTALSQLYLETNQISDLTPIQGLNLNLSELNLKGNLISDLTPLAGSWVLIYLWLGDNQITNLPSLEMPSLQYLTLSNNQISNLTSVAALSGLQWLDLRGNGVTEVADLVNNAGIDSGDTVFLENNPLAQIACATQIPTLQARGVSVSFDPCATEGEGEGEGEGSSGICHSADTNCNCVISLSELLRVIQFYNSSGFGCQGGTEDGYIPDGAEHSCAAHNSDQDNDWHISLSELLRLIQFYNNGGYHYCPQDITEDGYCPGLSGMCGGEGEGEGELLDNTMTLTRTPEGDAFYSPGVQKTITVQMSYTGADPVRALGLRETLPAGWTYDGLVSGTNNPTIPPSAGASGEIDFAWIVAPALPASFSYRTTPPAGAAGNQVINGHIVYRTSGGALASNDVETGLEEFGIIDVTPPELTLLGSNAITVECPAGYTDAGAAAVDLVDGDITGNIVTGGLPINTGVPGTYTITYNVSDAAGNAVAQVTRTVTVSDATPPVITLNGSASISLPCGGAYIEAGATATDSCDASVLVNTSGAVNTAAPGVYTVTYTATDDTGNSGSATRTVTVSDTTKPVVTLNGGASITIPCGGAYNEAGATASDACDASVLVNTSGTVNTAVPGVYTVTYTGADDTGNTGTATRTVTVTGPCGTDTAPVITLNGAASVTVECGGAYSDAGATAADVEDGDITADIGVAGLPVDTAVLGSHLITYDVADSTGRPAAQVSRTVTVRDTAVPVITLNGGASVTVACGEAYTDAGATGADACDGVVTALKSGIVDTDTPGVYTVIYTATDDSDNSGTATRSITVADSTKPTVTPTGNTNLTIPCGGDYFESGASATDACDGSLVVEISGSVNTDAVGVYTVTYSATDDSGNTGTATRRVTVSGPCANACRTACQDDDNPVDNDGDGLSACEEACFDTSDTKVDTDGDGMPDKFEADFNLNPLTDDAQADPDDDALSNLEEFWRLSSPRDANSPERAFYVSPSGEDGVRKGTADEPWQTIGFALQHVSASSASSARIIVRPGNYAESFALRPYVTVTGGFQTHPAISGAVTGARNSALARVDLKTTGDPVTLLTINNLAMTVSEVGFQGQPSPGSTGIAVRGLDAALSVIEMCSFNTLGTGISIYDNIPVIHRSRFEDLDDVGIIIHDGSVDTRDNPIGATGDVTTGYNLIDIATIASGKGIINERGSNINAQNNDWNINDEDSIHAAAPGTVVGPFLPAGGYTTYSSQLSCCVWNRIGGQNARISNATVTATPGLDQPVQTEDGVYLFSGVPQGRYTLSIVASGFVTHTETVDIALNSVSRPIPLQLAGAGEGEGEVDPPKTGGCGSCAPGQDSTTSWPSDITVMLAAASVLFLNRKPKHSWASHFQD